MQDSSDNKERKRDGGYLQLDVYRLSHSLAIQIHKLSLQLPKHEMFEEGSQIRRSSKSVPSNIVEGYVLRKYKAEYLHYLYRAQASSEETVEHLRLVFESGSFKDEKLYAELLESYNHLNSMLFKFIKSVEERHEKPLYLSEDNAYYDI